MNTVNGSASCTTCNTDFLTNDQQRTHFMSDWHKYNRKRRIASLDALSLESFATLAAASEQEQVETAAPDHHCIPCNKRYNSQNAYNNHIASKKHQATAKSYIPDFSSTIRAPKADDPHLDWKSRFDAIESDEALHALIREKISQATPLPANACLFCLHTSATLDASLHHMRHAHSFAPPRMERLADAPGMMAYLADKVALANLCLFCDAGLWHSLEAVQEHMRVKGHCKLAWEREEDRDELAEFYDWEEAGDEGGVNPGAIMALRRRRERALETVQAGCKSKALVHQDNSTSVFLMQQRVKVLALERAKVVQNGYIERKFKQREMRDNLSYQQFEASRLRLF